MLAALLAVAQLAGVRMLPTLRYERAAAMDGEAWRLVTGHLVHADLRHLGWNVLGVLIVWGLFAREYTERQWLLVIIASTVATSLGFLLLEPDLEWYVGFSGVLHGCMAAGLVASLRAGHDPVAWIVTGLFIAKLAWEHTVGPLPFTAGGVSIPVIHEAHTYGATGGLAAGLLLSRRTPARQAPL
jgi:rhomboid family GlyGly-CTERM serine protease